VRWSRSLNGKCSQPNGKPQDIFRTDAIARRGRISPIWYRVRPNPLLGLARRVPKHMYSARSQNLLDHDHASLHRHMLALDHVTNFIGHFDRMFVVGHKQGAQDCFEIVNSPHPSAGLKGGVASNSVYKIVNGVSFFDHALRLYEAPPLRGILGLPADPATVVFLARLLALPGPKPMRPHVRSWPKLT